MEDILLRLLITILVGAVGAFLFLKMKIPAGAMIGAIIFVSIFQIRFGIACFPKFIRVAVQMLSGAFVGQRITRGDIEELKTIVKPALLVFSCVMLLSLLTGFAIHGVSNLGLATGILASSPGGITDVVLIAADVGADPTQTTVLQLMRYFVSILLLPQINVALCRRFETADELGKESARRKTNITWKNLLLTALLTVVAGTLGKLSGLPAGTLVFAMVAVAGYNIKTENAFLPRELKIVAQCLAGINIGASITMTQVVLLPQLVIPTVLIIIDCFLINYGLGVLIYKVCGLDLATSLYSCVPAGLSDMALISLEQGGDASKVTVLQLVRFICVVAVMPIIIKSLCALLGAA